MSLSPLIPDKAAIFFSYSSEDKGWLEQLRKHLNLLKSLGIIAEWYDGTINAGDNWQHTTESYIAHANIFVLLISPDFFTSEYRYEVEMKRAFERQNEGTACVFPVYIRPIYLDIPGLPFKISDLLPGGKAIVSWPDVDEALTIVAQTVRFTIERLKRLAEQAADKFSVPGRQEPSPFPTPYRRNPFFTDRKEILKTLRNNLTVNSSSPARIQALTGLGGIGKTQLALEYAYRYEDQYQRIFWIHAASRQLLYADLAEQFAIAEEDCVSEQRLFAAVRHWLQQNKGWLLLLDDLEDLKLLKQLIPVRYEGHVLFTTHSRPSHRQAQVIDVPPFTDDEGALFLLRRAGFIAEKASADEASTADYQTALAIAHELDGHPLALDQAGAYIERVRNLSQYLTLYRLHRAELLQNRGPDPDDSHPESVSMTFQLAFDQVARIQPAAQELLYLFAFLHPDGIPDDMIIQGATELEGSLRVLAINYLKFSDTTATLFDFSLIYRPADASTWNIHRIVQAVLRDTLPPEQQRYWADTAVRLVNNIFPDGHYRTGTWAICQRYFPQAQHCATLIHDFHLVSEEAASLLHKLGCYSFERACYRDAESYLTDALIMRQQLDDADLDVAESLNELGMLYCKQGKFQQAESYYQRALSIYEQTRGNEHNDTIRVINNLALLYQELGHYLRAEPLYRRVLSIREATLSATDPDLAFSLNNLATLYYKQGKYRQTIPLLERAIVIREQSPGYEHPLTAQTVSNLAACYEALGQHHLAEPLYQRVLTTYEKSLAPEHPSLAAVLNNLAFLYHMQAKYHEAEPLYQRSLSIYEKALGPDHHHTARVLNNLGHLYQQQQRNQEAEPLLLRALSIREQALGQEHVDVARTLSYLADLYTSQSQYERADLLYQRARKIYQQSPYVDHPDHITLLENYALFLREKMQRPEEARALLDAASLLKKKDLP